jgi:hypothetical protein
MKGCQYRKNSIKKDSAGGDWMALDWTQELKSSYQSNSSERKMREATTWKGQTVVDQDQYKSLLTGLQAVGQVKE